MIVLNADFLTSDARGGGSNTHSPIGSRSEGSNMRYVEVSDAWSRWFVVSEARVLPDTGLIGHSEIDSHFTSNRRFYHGIQVKGLLQILASFNFQVWEIGQLEITAIITKTYRWCTTFWKNSSIMFSLLGTSAQAEANSTVTNRRHKGLYINEKVGVRDTWRHETNGHRYLLPEEELRTITSA